MYPVCRQFPETRSVTAFAVYSDFVSLRTMCINAGVVANIWEQSTGIVFAFDIEDASFQGDTSYDDVKGRLGFYAVDHTTDDVVTGYVETDGNGIRVTFTGSESGSVSAGDVYTLDKVD